MKREDRSVPSRQDVALQLERALAIEPSRWRLAWRVRSAHRPPAIRFDRPIRTLPISLTGRECALNCAHCGGRYLEHMRPVWDARADGATSCLISGGCDAEGRVPVTAHLKAVARLRPGRRLNWHVGLIDEDAMRTIAPLVDLISFDVVGDVETAREVYGLDLSLDDYMRTFDMLRRHARVVPHLTVGLRGGKLSGEMDALRALATRVPDGLVFILLIPTPGTVYARCSSPALPDVADLFLRARVMLPQARLYLGCMRPHGAYRQAVDELAVRAGVNVIVNPARAAQRTAAELGLEIAWGEECCALD